MQNDSNVSEHLDTKSIADTASSTGQFITILAKWRPPRRSNNPRVAE